MNKYSKNCFSNGELELLLTALTNTYSEAVSMEDFDGAARFHKLHDKVMSALNSQAVLAC
jgi:hypothetical protein